MPYPAPKTWVDGDTVTAAELNRIEAISGETFRAKGTEASLKAAVAAANSNGGGKVEAHGMAYTLTGTPLELAGDVWLEGGGATVITQANSQNLPAMIMSEGWDDLTGSTGSLGDGTARTQISDLIVSGNQDNNTGSTTHGVAIYGYRYNLHRVQARDTRGHGFELEWKNIDGYQPDVAEPGSLGSQHGPMEGRVIDCLAWGTRGAGIHHNGPNDSVIQGFTAGLCANASRGVTTVPSIWVDTKSLACNLDNCHSWSGGNYGFYFGSSVIAHNMSGEGALTANFGIAASGCRIAGGRSFYGPGWANAGYVGVEWLTGAFSTIIRGLHIEGCTSGAFKFTSSAGASDIDAYVYHTGSSTLYTGSPSTQATWSLSGAVGNPGVHPETLLPSNATTRTRGPRPT